MYNYTFRIKTQNECCAQMRFSKAFPTFNVQQMISHKKPLAN